MKYPFPVCDLQEALQPNWVEELPVDYNVYLGRDADPDGFRQIHLYRVLWSGLVWIGFWGGLNYLRISLLFLYFCSAASLKSFSGLSEKSHCVSSSINPQAINYVYRKSVLHHTLAEHSNVTSSVFKAEYLLLSANVPGIICLILFHVMRGNGLIMLS